MQIEGGNRRLSFVCIHNDWTKEEIRVAQVTDLIKALEGREHPVILAGGFNALPDAESMELVREAGFVDLKKDGPAATFPSDKPKVEIDHILVRGLNFDEAPMTKVHDEPLVSDHCPIFSVVPVPVGQ